MVAAEAAAAGCPPLVARHSGLAEIAEGIEERCPGALRRMAAFRTGERGRPRREAAGVLLALPPAERPGPPCATPHRRDEVEHRWSWASVADRLLQPFK